MSLTVRQISNEEWLKHWAGHWSVLSCTYFGHQYTQTIGKELGVRMQNAVFISKKGYSTAFLDRGELESFGNALARKVEADKKIAAHWCAELRKRTDRITAVMERHYGKELDESQFQEFLDAFYDYVSPHIAVKKVVDYLPPKVLEELLPQLEGARLYSEKVYAESEKFVQAFAKRMGEKTGCRQELALCATKEEIADYFITGKLPPRETLAERFEAGALLFQNGSYELVTGREVADVEDALTSEHAGGELRGKTAYPGVAAGKVRIVLDPKNALDFEAGSVLVTGMTRPEYGPIVKKAVAIVTDAGGVLCHAAIVAREMKKPCIVGTEKATKVFHDGEMVEVDATKGTVRRI